jgi:hypothetical protein
VLGLLF